MDGYVLLEILFKTNHDENRFSRTELQVVGKTGQSSVLVVGLADLGCRVCGARCRV